MRRPAAKAADEARADPPTVWWPMSHAAPVLSVTDLSVKLGGVEVVRGVTFDLHAGDLALLSGPNGAGKSTLLRALVYLLPFGGEVAHGGHHPASLAARAHVVFVPDEAALYEDLTLAEHVQFTLSVYERPEAEERMLAWLGRFRLGDRLAEFPSTHSRGMRQKLSLALALGLNPALLILDEPFNGLDTEAQGLLVEALRERAAGGGAVLLTAHQGELRAALEARHLELSAGELTALQPVPQSSPQTTPG